MALGVLLKVDRLTSIHSRGEFACICVEVDLAKSLIPQVEVRGEIINLEYGGLHSVCFTCGVYGHRAAECKSKLAMVSGSKNQGGGGQEQATGVPEGAAQPRDAIMTSIYANSVNIEKGINEIGGTPEDTNQGENLEEESQKVSYGPWMLSKKERKGRQAKRQPKPGNQGGRK